MNLNGNGIGIGAVAQQYAAFGNDDIKRVGATPATVGEPPIQEMLSRLTALMEDTHMAMTSLELQLEPVRGATPTGDVSDKPMASLPTQIENRLMNLQEGLQSLHRRITTTRNELRI